MIKVSNKTNFLIVDAGMNTFLRPALYNSFHNIIPAINKNNKDNYCVVGPICESSDIFVKNIILPKQNINDILIIEDVGAYGSVMSSNYNSKILPAEIMVDGKNHSIIRCAQNINECIQNSNTNQCIMLFYLQQIQATSITIFQITANGISCTCQPYCKIYNSKYVYRRRRKKISS